jgi:sodium pump decarboxylase gamma subunit
MIEGFVVMVVGVTVVFAFLGLLVLVMQMSALFFTRFAHWFPDAPMAVEMPKSNATDLTKVAVAIAAVKAHIG